MINRIVIVTVEEVLGLAAGMHRFPATARGTMVDEVLACISRIKGSVEPGWRFK